MERFIYFIIALILGGFGGWCLAKGCLLLKYAKADEGMEEYRQKKRRIRK
jgi:hypothetical protein